MAIYPCDRHQQRYQGPQRTAYPALLDGTITERQKRRLCHVCFRVLRSWCIEKLRGYDSEAQGEGCSLCGAEDPSVAIFVTLYDHKADREDWFGRCCAACAHEEASIALFGTVTTLGPM